MNLPISLFKEMNCIINDNAVSAFNKYAEIFSLNTIPRLLAFLPNIFHETGNLKWYEELASGDAYDTRVDLGNTPQKDGDGKKYKGRGWGHVTGKRNYAAFTVYAKSKGMDIDFVKYPERLKEIEPAILSAFWFWEANKLQKYADLENYDSVDSVWNTGKPDRIPNGKEERWNIRKKLDIKLKKLLQASL